MNLNQLIVEDSLENASTEEIFDVIFYSSDIPCRMQLSFELFHKDPSYRILYNMGLDYGSFSESERVIFWNNYGEYLNQGDIKYLEPILYSLNMDFFNGEKDESMFMDYIKKLKLNDNAQKLLGWNNDEQSTKRV